MALDVIGAGFGRTGTLSLKNALEQLGFGKCYHMFEVYRNPSHFAIWSNAHTGKPVDWDRLFAGYRSTTDWPSCNLWREQMIRYPDAKLLLSLRDPESWYRSVMSTIYPSTMRLLHSDDEQQRRFGEWAMDIIWKRVFDNRMGDANHVMDVFTRHNETVIATVPADRLLVFEAKDGWPPLCEFLGVPVPDEDYPRVNTSQGFQQNADSKRP